MYQAQLEDNPQLDVQAAYRLFRQGKQQNKVHIYRVMMNTLADKMVLEKQVTRAAGWLHSRANPRDVKPILCLHHPGKASLLKMISPTNHVNQIELVCGVRVCCSSDGCWVQ